MNSSWQPIIGLEVHVELKTKSKMFCSCPNRHFREPPNTHVCPVCLGLPGALPVPNQEAIKQTILIAAAFHCQINRQFWFDRKNYFYPDLPKGYQISQHFRPIGEKGYVPVLINNQKKKIFLDNVHLEEDTGKLIHQGEETLIDYNRSGVPLVEIVTQPCLHSPQEAKAYLKRLQQVLRWLEVSDCDMEKGSMRLEANISVQRQTETGLPTYKVEVKNLNSFRFVEKAIEYEINRQIEILKQGKIPKQETRGFDPERGVTFSQRSKEVAKDYRYFPEPDIPPFEFSPEEIKEIKSSLPQLPWEWEEKLAKWEIPPVWFETLLKSKKLIANFYQAVLLGKKEFTPKQIASLLVNQAQMRNKPPKEIIASLKKAQNQYSLDKEKMTELIKEVIKEQPKAVEDFQKGKTQVVGFLIGQVQKKAKGKADPKLAAQLIIQELKSLS